MSNFVSFKISPIIEFSNNSFCRVFVVVASFNLISTIIYNHFVWSDLIYLNESGLDASDRTFVSGSKTRLIINIIVEVTSPIWLLFKSFVFSILMYSVGYLLKFSFSFTELNKIFLVSYLFVILEILLIRLYSWSLNSHLLKMIYFITIHLVF